MNAVAGTPERAKARPYSVLSAAVASGGVLLGSGALAIALGWRAGLASSWVVLLSLAIVIASARLAEVIGFWGEVLPTGRRWFFVAAEALIGVLSAAAVVTAGWSRLAGIVGFAVLLTWTIVLLVVGLRRSEPALAHQSWVLRQVNMVSREAGQAPWSARGWSSDVAAREASTEMEAIVQAAEGSIRARAHMHDRPGYVLTPVMHNPYLNLPLVAVFIVGVFMLGKLDEVTGWIVFPFVGLVCLASLALLVSSVARIPSWHRARKAAREYVDQHGGRFPPDLRWHS